jgi:hypothetical protein
VLHHIQDQAQPQHVRNDPHCDAGLCQLMSLAITGLGSPSAYEAYVGGIVPTNTARFTQLAMTGPQGPLNVLPTPAFTLPTDFWSTGGSAPNTFGIGLSEFDSYNFLSVGTSPMATSSSLAPDPAHRQPSNFVQQVRSTGCSAPNPQPDEVLDQIYLTGSIIDNEGAGPASSGAYQSYVDVPLGILSGAAKFGSSTTQWTVAQNCVTYDQAMYLLVPQAIRYSAWFIDFMFRGSISATVATSGALSITNNSQSEPMTSGVFQLYADDGSGNRSPVGNSCSLAAIPPGLSGNHRAGSRSGGVHERFCTELLGCECRLFDFGQSQRALDVLVECNPARQCLPELWWHCWGRCVVEWARTTGSGCSDKK